MKLLSTRSVDHLLSGQGFSAPYQEPLSLEWEFTETCRRAEGLSPAAREVACLRVMFPAILRPIQDGDLLAGRIRYPVA